MSNHNNDGKKPMTRFMPSPAYLKVAAGREDETNAEYERRGNWIMRDLYDSVFPLEPACKRGEFPDWDPLLEALCVNPGLVIEYLKVTRIDLMTVSFRKNRNALKHWLSMRGLEGIAELIRQIRPNGCGTRRNPPPKGPRTSTTKSKFILLKAMIALLGALHEIETADAKLAGLWIYFGVLFGVRPKEWYSAKLMPATSNNKAYLLVKNAKYGHNRAHGLERKIVFESISKRIYVDLQCFLANFPSLKNGKTKKEYKLVYERCQKLIARVGKELWPERKTHPTLYSCRHQFVANAKLANLPKVEIAALLGHATDKTATREYAPKRKGTAGFFYVSAHPDDVARVRQVYDPGKFEAFQQAKAKLNSNLPAENNAAVEDAVSSSFEGDEYSIDEEMRGPSSDEPDWNTFMEINFNNENLAEPDFDGDNIKKPSDDDPAPG